MADFSMDELTKEVFARMEAARERSQEISRISKVIADGSGTYADVERLASLTGKSTGKVLADALVEKVVDGKVTEEVAKAILSKPLEGNYEAIAESCQQAQEALNRKAGLGLKAVKPELPRSRINGLVTEVTGKDDMNNFAGTLVQQVENLSLSTVDDSVRANAAAHSRAGLHPKIKRISDGKCCKWCSALAGTYDYYDVNDTGNDVFRRHNNCRCQILYDPGDGARLQDVYSKRLLSAEESAKIESRKTYGLDIGEKTQLATPEITNLRNEYVARSVGAKSRNYDIMDLQTGEMYHLAEGEILQDKEVFAGKGTRVPYRKAWKYAEKYGGKEEDWQHVKAFGVISTPDGDRRAEIHWSQCEGIGKKDLNIKKWLD